MKLLAFARLALVLFAVTVLPAQVVHVGNYCDAPFDGWKRCTVDIMPPHPAGHVSGPNGNCDYVLGRQVGLDTRVIDLRVQLAPWQVTSFDLAASTAWNFVPGPLPANPVQAYGAPTIAGTLMQPVSTQPDGAGWLSHFRARTGEMLCTDLWLCWYPDQPSWARGEVVVTASNPTVTFVKAVVPHNFVLRCGTAGVQVPGASLGAPLMPFGTTLVDGQARSFPAVLFWPQHISTPAEAASIYAASKLAIAANGISRLWPDGNPQLSPGQSALTWTATHFDGAVARLHSWDAGPLGVTANSGQTGAQEDQVFVGAECMALPDGLGAETVRYLVALGQSRRPCHHLEADGSQLSLTTHPQLVMWDSRVHYDPAVSPDRLGKRERITRRVTHDWWGPDEEHLLLNTLSIAARLTGSPALQWQLSANARAFLYQKTVAPGLSTTRPGAARAVGWEGLAAVHLWTNLEDRALAQLVASRWVDRVLLVHQPQLSNKVGGIWDPRFDRRLGSTGWKNNWMPYQQSVGAWGLDYASRLIGPSQGRTLALAAALAVGNRAFSWSGSQWVGWGYVGYDGVRLVPLVQGAGAHYGAGLAQWNTLAVATVLAHYPTPTMQAVWAQYSQGGGTWVPPGL